MGEALKHILFGAGYLFDFSGSRVDEIAEKSHRKLMKILHTSDNDKIRGDFSAVGNDLKAALAKAKQRYER